MDGAISEKIRTLGHAILKSESDITLHVTKAYAKKGTCLNI